MSKPRIARARDLLDEIETALEEAGVAGVSVTLDPLKVPSASRLKAGGAVLIRPPALKFLTAVETEATWTVVLVSGPADNPLAAWERLDEMIDALSPALDVTSAEPTGWKGARAEDPIIPAYEMSLFN